MFSEFVLSLGFGLVCLFFFPPCLSQISKSCILEVFHMGSIASYMWKGVD